MLDGFDVFRGCLRLLHVPCVGVSSVVGMSFFMRGGCVVVAEPGC
jgi:hypothetical protein